MNLTGVVATYFDDLLGSDGAEWFTQLASALSDGGAVPLAKLQLRLTAEFLADGWEPPPGLELPFDDDWHTLGAQSEADASPAKDAVADTQELQARVDGALARATGSYGPAFVADQMEALRREVVQLRHAMASRASIEQAKGILMNAYGLTAERAWAYLTRVSQERSQKVRDIADEIIRSGPGASSPDAA